MLLGIVREAPATAWQLQERLPRPRQLALMHWHRLPRLTQSLPSLLVLMVLLPSPPAMLLCQCMRLVSLMPLEGARLSWATSSPSPS